MNKTTSIYKITSIYSLLNFTKRGQSYSKKQVVQFLHFSKPQRAKDFFYVLCKSLISQMLLWKRVGNHFPVGTAAITPQCPPSASLSNKFTLTKNTNLTTCAFTSDVLWGQPLKVRIRLESSLYRFICLTFFITLLLSLLAMCFCCLELIKQPKSRSPLATWDVNIALKPHWNF